jgi:hypothetical protein
MLPVRKSGTLTVAPITGLPSALSVTVPVSVLVGSSGPVNLGAAFDIIEASNEAANSTNILILVFI